MEYLRSLLQTLQDLGWAAELFAVVILTLLVRFIAMRFLKVLAGHLSKTENTWDDALFEAARAPLSWFILIMGLLWGIGISDGYVEAELFSAENLLLVRQLTFVVLITMFLVRFSTLAEVRLLEKLKEKPASVQTRLDPTTLHALAKLVRLAVIISAVLIAMPTIGKSVV